MTERTGAIILCGGESRRMGCDKASLPFGEGTLATHVAGILSPVVDEIVLAGRPGQDLPDRYRSARDAVGGQGPLAGLVTGLQALDAERVFLAACDMPFIRPAFVKHVFELGREFPMAVPVDARGRLFPIGGVYGREVLPPARELLARGERRLHALSRKLNARFIELPELEPFDPELESLISIDTPQEYEDALRRAGLSGGDA